MIIFLCLYTCRVDTLVCKYKMPYCILRDAFILGSVGFPIKNPPKKTKNKPKTSCTYLHFDAYCRVSLHCCLETRCWRGVHPVGVALLIAWWTYVYIPRVLSSLRRQRYAQFASSSVSVRSSRERLRASPTSTDSVRVVHLLRSPFVVRRRADVHLQLSPRVVHLLPSPLVTPTTARPYDFYRHRSWMFADYRRYSWSCFAWSTDARRRCSHSTWTPGRHRRRRPLVRVPRTLPRRSSLRRAWNLIYIAGTLRRRRSTTVRTTRTLRSFIFSRRQPSPALHCCRPSVAAVDSSTPVTADAWSSVVTVDILSPPTTVAGIHSLLSERCFDCS